VERGHRYSDCLDYTLAQVRAFVQAHQQLAAHRAARFVHHVRLAAWGEAADVERYLGDLLAPQGGHPGGHPGDADLAEALAAMGCLQGSPDAA
jgi:hypothetical protein